MRQNKATFNEIHLEKIRKYDFQNKQNVWINNIKSSEVTHTI